MGLQNQTLAGVKMMKETIKEVGSPSLAGGNLCRNDAVSLLEKDFVCFCLF